MNDIQVDPRVTDGIFCLSASETTRSTNVYRDDSPVFRRRRRVNERCARLGDLEAPDRHRHAVRRFPARLRRQGHDADDAQTYPRVCYVGDCETRVPV